MLDGGIIGGRDAVRLFELRLDNTGTLDEYPEGHTTADKVSESVGYMQSTLDQ